MTTMTRDELLALDAALVDAEQNVRLAREVIQRLMQTLEQNTPPVKNGDTPHPINVSAIPAEGHL